MARQNATRTQTRAKAVQQVDDTAEHMVNSDLFLNYILGFDRILSICFEVQKLRQYIEHHFRFIGSESQPKFGTRNRSKSIWDKSLFKVKQNESLNAFAHSMSKMFAVASAVKEPELEQLNGIRSKTQKALLALMPYMAYCVKINEEMENIISEKGLSTTSSKMGQLLAEYELGLTDSFKDIVTKTTPARFSSGWFSVGQPNWEAGSVIKAISSEVDKSFNIELFAKHKMVFDPSVCKLVKHSSSRLSRLNWWSPIAKHIGVGYLVFEQQGLLELLSPTQMTLFDKFTAILRNIDTAKRQLSGGLTAVKQDRAAGLLAKITGYKLPIVCENVSFQIADKPLQISFVKIGCKIEVEAVYSLDSQVFSSLANSFKLHTKTGKANFLQKVESELKNQSSIDLQDITITSDSAGSMNQDMKTVNVVITLGSSLSISIVEIRAQYIGVFRAILKVIMDQHQDAKLKLEQEAKQKFLQQTLEKARSMLTEAELKALGIG